MRPEIDEVDRFRDRTTKDRKTNARKTTESKQSSGPGRPGTTSTSISLKPKTSKPTILFIMILIAGCAYLGWLSIQQQSQIEALNTELKDAVGFISQSKLLLARLEGDLSETGQEIAQSGTAVDKKLAFLDSEMRKLWGVANDRNKKAISQNKDLSESLKLQLAKLQKQLKAAETQTEKSNDSFESLISQNKQSVKGLQSQLSLASGEMAITRDSLEQQVSTLSQKFDQQSKVVKRIDDNAQALESVNASRKQLNDRVLALTEQVSRLQKQVNNANAVAPNPQ